MKRLIALTSAIALALAGCGSSSSSAATAAASTAAASAAASEAAETTAAAAEQSEVIVFAAASMTETLNQIKETYEAENPGVTLTFNFDSSGTLKTQIQEGADCDLFISAGQKQMNQLDITASSDVNTDGLDFVDPDTRVNLLENKITLAVPEGNPKGIESFDQLADLLKNGDVLMAIGNSDVPVGQYTQKILAYYGLDETTLANEGKITYGTNVKEVTTQISEASVDCGVIYETDAYSAGLTTVDSATPEMCGQVIYPAAVLKTAKNPDGAKKFLDYLQTDEAMKVFESVGFSAVTAE
ncbi:MAG: molybdate ABC transporter substrate-binding protein [Erysipelotrichaceae bacterium]|nr:molybdate ABC transporter substrate-binding protein [Erysipelotrichaceae bacterium]